MVKNNYGFGLPRVDLGGVREVSRYFADVGIGWKWPQPLGSQCICRYDGVLDNSSKWPSWPSRKVGGHLYARNPFKFDETRPVAFDGHFTTGPGFMHNFIENSGFEGHPSFSKVRARSRGRVAPGPVPTGFKLYTAASTAHMLCP